MQFAYDGGMVDGSDREKDAQERKNKRIALWWAIGIIGGTAGCIVLPIVLSDREDLQNRFHTMADEASEDQQDATDKAADIDDTLKQVRDDAQENDYDDARETTAEFAGVLHGVDDDLTKLTQLQIREQHAEHGFWSWTARGEAQSTRQAVADAIQSVTALRAQVEDDAHQATAFAAGRGPNEDHGQDPEQSSDHPAEDQDQDEEPTPPADASSP
jgi:hypothetical protein